MGYAPAPDQLSTAHRLDLEECWYTIGYVAGYEQRSLELPDRLAWAGAYKVGYTQGQTDWRGLDAEWADAWYAERSGFTNGDAA
jgi:hypothetical protein